MSVLNAVEVNRVLDYAQQGLTRVINGVVPNVKADLVTYSSYDSTLQGTDPGSLAQAMNLALNTINNLAPDPVGLGSRRVLISEYGLYENDLPGQTKWAGADHSSDCQKGRFAGRISVEPVRQ